MKPAPFAYARAGSLEQVFDLLARYGDQARLVAGGQNLVPTPHLRLSTPAILIDLEGLTEFARMNVDNGARRIRAPTPAHARRVRRGRAPRPIARHGDALRRARGDPQPAHRLDGTLLREVIK